MTSRLVCILFVACFITYGCGNEKAAAPVATESKFVGDWLEQQYYSKEFVAGLAKETPAAERASQEEELARWLRRPHRTFRLFADGTCEILGTATDPAKEKGESWALSDDGKTVSITFEHLVWAFAKGPDGRTLPEIVEEMKTTTLKLALSDDGQTLSDPDASEHYGKRYLRAGSDAAKRAFDGEAKL
ncbi:MAG: hypothetical protein WD716_13355 [Fimbriimonadaceae bacterium]